MDINKTIESIHRISARDKLEKLGLSSQLEEMAMSIKDYVRKVDGLRFQLVENWCLCKWCQMFDADNENFIHWAEELEAYINALKFISLKAGDKKKILSRILVDAYDYNDIHMVASIIEDKFKVEHINNEDQTRAVAEAFASSIDGLIALMSNKKMSTDSYIKATFI